MNRKGFTLIELLIVVVIIGILAAIAIPKFASTKEKAYLASMKSDLRNLVTAEEAYFESNQAYLGGTASNLGGTATPLDATTQYVPSAGVTVTVGIIATPAGWNAQATHTATTKVCNIFLAGAQTNFGLATVEGEPRCTP
ncbi:MAG TPA: prepilin-type N-terminal cleavage/methylation domain-containing protein [Gemmatimonadales bacterium]|nr:prepilin-type N-terminal cleavage/methylation domain-containing protein [Gemmatimonadales bacterium]